MSLKSEIPSRESGQKRVGYALVGLGKLSAEELIPAARRSESAYVAAAVTGEDERDRALGLGLSGDDVYSYDEFEKLAERSDVQAVYIVLPNALHREYVERAARIGKHVLCEKPLGISTEDAQAMVDACREAGVRLMTAYRCQYTPEHWAARRAVQSGALGPVRIIDSVHTHVESDPGAWRLKKDLAGGGPLPDIGLYSVNSIRFVLGQEPLWVFAHAEQPDDERFAEVEASMGWVMGFPGGVIATCLTSYAAHDVSTLRVVGERGSVLLDPAFAYGGLRVVTDSREGRQELTFPAYDQFTNEFDHFAACIREGQTPWTPGEEGVADHRVMDALYESARTGQRVALPGAGEQQEQDAHRGERLPERADG